jgi:flagellar basal-body rod modification protein FlgD
MSTSAITANLAAMFGAAGATGGTNTGGTSTGGTTTGGTTGTGTTGTTTGLPSGQSLNNMFLQLLVAQLQNQDPTSPVDPSQFVGQLAQFSELSEVTSIYTLLQQVVPTTAGSGTGTGSGNGGTTGGATGGTAGGTTTGGAATGTAFSPTSHPASAGSVSSLPSAASAPAASAAANFASPSIFDLIHKIQGVF